MRNTHLADVLLQLSQMATDNGGGAGGGVAIDNGGGAGDVAIVDNDGGAVDDIVIIVHDIIVIAGAAGPA